jgi:hypothetical protein
MDGTRQQERHVARGRRCAGMVGTQRRGVRTASTRARTLEGIRPVGRAVCRAGIDSSCGPGPLRPFFLFKYFCNLVPMFWVQKYKTQSSMCPKISTLHMVEDNFKWNTFPFWSIFQISLDFELNWRFRSKFESPENCSLRLILTTISNPPELNFGQEVIHGDLQFLHYDLVDIHKLTLKIQEVMKFRRWLIVKLILKKFSSLKIVLYSSILEPWNKYFLSSKFFFRFAHFLFWKCDLIRFQ